MRSLFVALALFVALPAAATEVSVLLDSGETLTGELVRFKTGKFYLVRPEGESKPVKLKWDQVVDIQSLDPAEALDLGEDNAGTGLPEDARRSKNPLGDVEQLANRHEQQLVAELEGYAPPSSFWMVRKDAGAVAASALPPEATIVEADADHIATDYLWTTEEGIEEGAGEWHEQRRERLVVDISPGPFVSVEPYREIGVRRYYGGKGEPIWKTEKEPLELNLDAKLREIEAETLADTAVILAPTEARRLMKESAPEGFELEATDDGVIATRRWTAARGNPKTGEWARWERVHTVTFTLTGEGSEKRVSVATSEAERVITSEREPELSPSLTVDPRPAEQLLRGLLEGAGVRARMPSALLEPVAAVAEESPAPAVPALRTWQEVRADQEAESLETLTGVWRLQQPHVTVPAARSDGSTYDEATEEDGPEPDIALFVDISGNIGDLEVAPNTLEHTWRWQTDQLFQRGGPPVLVTIADIDGEDRETIGFCELKLEDMLETSWLKCGASAKVSFELVWVDPAPADEFELPEE